MEDVPSPKSSLELLIPVFTIGLVVLVQAMFWLPSFSSRKETAEQDGESVSNEDEDIANGNFEVRTDKDDKPESEEKKSLTTNNRTETDADTKAEVDSALLTSNNNTWRCACEGGFLPPGMLKSFGTAEAMMRLGTGQCYHKQT